MKKSIPRLPKWCICPRCGSKYFMYQKLTDTYWCRKCGQEFVIDFKLCTTRTLEKKK